MAPVSGGTVPEPGCRLTRRDTFAFSCELALGEVDRFAAFAARVRPIKFVRKDLSFFAAAGTFAAK
jgi:hypothetical protein